MQSTDDHEILYDLGAMESNEYEVFPGDDDTEIVNGCADDYPSNFDEGGFYEKIEDFEKDEEFSPYDMSHVENTDAYHECMSSWRKENFPGEYIDFENDYEKEFDEFAPPENGMEEFILPEIENKTNMTSMPSNMTKMETKLPRFVVDPGNHLHPNGVIVIDSDDEKAPEEIDYGEYAGYYEELEN